jgi:hypothetical protein
MELEPTKLREKADEFWNKALSLQNDPHGADRFTCVAMLYRAIADHLDGGTVESEDDFINACPTPKSEAGRAWLRSRKPNR